jgi:hypothetical protein
LLVEARVAAARLLVEARVAAARLLVEARVAGFLTGFGAMRLATRRESPGAALADRLVVRFVVAGGLLEA